MCVSVTEKVTKVCNSDGQWFRHPESDRVWSNYTQCQIYTKGKLEVGPGQEGAGVGGWVDRLIDTIILFECCFG